MRKMHRRVRSEQCPVLCSAAWCPYSCHTSAGNGRTGPRAFKRDEEPTSSTTQGRRTLIVGPDDHPCRNAHPLHRPAARHNVSRPFIPSKSWRDAKERGCRHYRAVPNHLWEGPGDCQTTPRSRDGPLVRLNRILPCSDFLGSQVCLWNPVSYAWNDQHSVYAKTAEDLSVQFVGEAGSAKPAGQLRVLPLNSACPWQRSCCRMCPTFLGLRPVQYQAPFWLIPLQYELSWMFTIDYFSTQSAPDNRESQYSLEDRMRLACLSVGKGEYA